jgi:type IV secretory pathway VirB4 component
LIGRDLAGSAFVHDPFELYRLEVLTNPNMLVLGQIGRGKSAFVKTYCYRHAAFGRRVVVVDPKGEYGPLAEALGVRPLVLVPGGTLRLNPLELHDPGEKGRRQRLAILGAVAATLLGRALRPVEHALLEAALQRIGGGVALFGDVVEHLLAPGPEVATALSTPLGELRREGRDLALSLRRLVVGELSGLFDAPTSAEIDLDAPALILDLSALYQSSALGVVILCVQATLEALAHRRAGQTLVVVDEAWALFSNPAAAQFLQASLKLARARGVANILVTHRISDLGAAAAGIAGRLVEGLVADCETVVCYAQSEAEVAHTTRALGLSAEEARLLPRLRRGVALWRVGRDPYLVEHHLGLGERSLVDTDAALLS